MHQSALDRTQGYLAEKGISAALFANPFTITWLTGYAPPIQTGPNPFEGGPALAWWQDGELTLLVSSDEASAAEASGAPLHIYTGYTIEEPLQGATRQADALRRLLQAAGRLTGIVGVELDWLAAPFLRVLQESLPHASIQPLDGELDPLRAIKSDDEISLIRAALALSDLAQAEVARLIRPGLSELALWGQIKDRIEQEAGSRIPVLADVVAGPRTVEVGGPPTAYVLQENDPLILDFVPRRNGYWGDNAAVHFAGTPSAELSRMREVAWDALRWGLDQLRPGTVARDLDRALRDRIRAAGYPPYPHHTGHGIGVSYHEEPRIVPYNPMTLQAGMVVALEPGIYLPGVGGVRLEHVALVTQDGCDVLTRHL